MSKKQRTKKELERAETAEVLLANYKNLACSVFKWEGLPKGIPPLYPETWLFQNGMACMVKMAEDDYVILPVAYGSVKLNVYGLPTEWRAYAVGSSPQAQEIRNRTLNEDNSVLIWNDYERRPTYPFIGYLVKKMVNVDATTDCNINAQKTPYVFRCNNNNLFTAKAYAKAIADGEEFVFKDDFDNVAVEVIPTQAPFVADKLMDVYLEYHNRILSYLGVDNLPVEKQERMLTGETEANDEALYLVREARLQMRKDACRKINELWGLNVEVDYNDKFEGLSVMSRALQTNGSNRDIGEKSGQTIS
jgi:hypothetical protein